MLSGALDWAARGCPVFPCKAAADGRSGAKAPHLPGESRKGAQDGGHWLASRDPALIRDWWTRWPDALIGLPTGLRSNAVVVDLDPRDVPADAMLAALAHWCGGLGHVDAETGEVLQPAVSRTQSGGLHLWFAYPPPEIITAIGERLAARGQAFAGRIENPVNVFRRFVEHGEAPPELAHIDVRAEGGYVIAPPSVMADGKRYEWLLPPDNPLPPLPRKPLGVIARLSRTQRDIREERQRAEMQRRMKDRPIASDKVSAIVDRKVRALLTILASAPEGQRNKTIFWVALKLGEIVLGGHMARTEAEALLLAHLPAGVSASERRALTAIRNGLDFKNAAAWQPFGRAA